MNKPVILVAFAEYSRQGDSFLRELGREQLGIKNALDEATEKGLCEYEIIPDADVHEIMKAVEKYGDRLVAFHFAGHANGYQLMIESDTRDGSQGIYAEGLGAYLQASSPNLRFVFLNACSTQGQVDDFLDNGVPLVIATSQAIEDRIARQFAVHFYDRLAKGSTIKTAYESFEHLHRMQKTPLRSLFIRSQVVTDAFPWEIYPKAGADKAKDWSLPKATNNCLFFLPALPPDILQPRLPYKGIQSYGRSDAAIFWGRSCMIKDVYDEVMAPNLKSSPLLLFYGPSGVGKSSLLRAGLLPRIEDRRIVFYAARNKASSLSDVLQGYFEVEDNSQIAKAWAQQEEKEGKPLLIFLDQVEEIYTESGTIGDSEMRQLGKLIHNIFTGPEKIKIQGKIVLSFREEFLAKVEDDLTDEIPFLIKKFFVRRLSRNEIIEVIEGPREKYNLSLDRDLSIRIADDLTEDENSAIAPVLQILLTKMWSEASKSAQPVFTQELYQDLKKEGQLMDYFILEQLEEIRSWNRQAVDSGLIHDLLYFHTTEIGTSRKQDFDDLLERYAHHSRDFIEQILGLLRQRYLLNTAGQDSAGDPTTTRLTHDILAPLVRREYNKSIRPGQTATKLVNSKMETGKNKIPFNDAELKIIDEGRIGMRALTSDEVKFINECIAKNLQLRRGRRILLGALLAVTLVVFAISGFYYKQSRDTRFRKIFQQGRLIEPTDPTKALSLKSEAWLKLKSDFLLKEDLNNTYRNHVFYNRVNRIPARDTNVRVAWFSDLGEYLVQTDFEDNDYDVFLYELDGNGDYMEKSILTGPVSTIYSLKFSHDGKWLIGGGADHRLHFWEIGNNLKSDIYPLPELYLSNRLERVDMNEGKTIFAAGDNEGHVFLWTAEREETLPFQTIQLAGVSSVEVLCLHPESTLLVAGNENGIGVYDFEGNPVVDPANFGYTDISDVTFSKGGQYFAVAAEKAVHLWEVQSDTALYISSFDHEGMIDQVVFSPDDQLLASVSGKVTRIWGRAKADAPLRTLIGHQSQILDISFDRDHEYIWSTAEDGSILRWDLPYDVPYRRRQMEGRLADIALDNTGNRALAVGRSTVEIMELPALQSVGSFTGHETRIKSIAVAEESGHAITADRSGSILLWEIESQQLVDSIQTSYDITDLSIAANGSLALIGTTDSMVILWSIGGTGSQRLRSLNGHRAEVKAVAMSADLTSGLTAGFDSLVILWDLQAGTIRDTFQADDYVYGAEFLNNKKDFSFVTRPGNVTIRSFSGKTLLNTSVSSEINQMVWAFDGSSYAVLTIDGQVFLFDSEGYPIRNYFSEDPIRRIITQRSGEFVLGYNRRNEVVMFRNDRRGLENFLEK